MTLRILQEREGKQFLSFVTDVPAGSIISVGTSIDRGRFLYVQRSRLIRSHYGWYQGVSVESWNGKIENANLDQYSPQDIYISATFKNVADPIEDESPVASDQTVANCRLAQLARQGVPEEPLRRAFEFFESYKSRIANKNWLSLADYSQNSKNRRFYLIDMQKCKVAAKEFVAHGSGSMKSRRGKVQPGDPDHDGMLNRCVYNGRRLNMTRPGFMLVKGWHQSGQSWPVLNGRNGAKGVKLRGMESRNADVFGRAVVMHEASYVHNSARVQGRSFGCPAFAMGRLRNILKITRGEFNKGTLFYAHTPMCE